MALAQSKRTYIIGWDGCGSLPIRNGRRITPGPDRHFKTNHRLAFPSCPHMDRQIQETASFKLKIKCIKSCRDLTLEENSTFYNSVPPSLLVFLDLPLNTWVQIRS